MCDTKPPVLGQSFKELKEKAREIPEVKEFLLRDKIKELRLQGKGYKLIATELGITKDRVRGYCKRLNMVGVMGKEEYKRKPKLPNHCAVCNTETSRNRKYCSRECQKEGAKAKRMPYKNECAYCRKEFPSMGKLTRTRCCSTECGNELRRREKWPWKYEIITCGNCNIQFTPKREGQRFCSGSCAGKGTMEDNLNGLMTHEDYITKLSKRYIGVIEALTEYTTIKDKMRYSCKMCGHEFVKVARDMLSRGKGCPRCSGGQSVGVTKIEEWLINNNIKHEKEHRFDDCRYKHPLPFDFAILSGGKCIAIIEFNGDHHYRSLEHWGGEEYFNKIRRNDKIKRDYCNHNNIPLIDIDYSEQDRIEEILDGAIKVSITIKKPRTA